MRSLLLVLAPVLHLTRITTAFAAVGNVWFVILWTRSNGREPGVPGSAVIDGPLSAALVFGGIAAVGLFAFAMALNDTLDVRRDRALHPERPLPSGQMSVEHAVWLVAASLVVSMVGAAGLGIAAVWMCALCAVAIFGYHVVWRFFPSVGLVALGLIYALHMLIPNHALVFVWPVWLVMTHALCVWTVSHYLGMKRPALSARMVIGVVTGWLLWSGVLLWVGRARSGALWPEWVSPWAGMAPLLLAGAFVLIVVAKIRSAGRTARAGEKVQRYGALWLTLYSAAWLLGHGRLEAALLLMGLAIGGLVGMTVLRELFALIEQPIGYRR